MTSDITSHFIFFCPGAEFHLQLYTVERKRNGYLLHLKKRFNVESVNSEGERKTPIIGYIRVCFNIKYVLENVKNNYWVD